MKAQTVRIATMKPVIVSFSIGAFASGISPETKVLQLRSQYERKSPDGVLLDDDKVIKWDDLKWVDLLPLDDRNAIDAAKVMRDNSELVAELTDLLKQAAIKRLILVGKLGVFGHTMPNIPDAVAVSVHAGGSVPNDYAYTTGTVYPCKTKVHAHYGLKVNAIGANGKPSDVTTVIVDGAKEIVRAGFQSNHTGKDAFSSAAFEVLTKLCGRNLKKGDGGLNAPREFGLSEV
jgi:hypothetical protein